MSTPLSASDLHELSEGLDALNDLLVNQETGEYVEAAEYISSVGIQLRDNPGTEIGHLVFEDDWIGFEFSA